MYEQSLTQIGLNYTQAVVYETLLKSGKATARKIINKTPYKRGLVYSALETLEKMGLIERIDKEKKISVFQAKHPLTLEDFADKSEQRAKNAKLALKGIMPAIISDFNLVSERPGMLFYEGEAGIRETLNDSLKAKMEIYTYADMESVVKYMDKINKDYVKKRSQLGLKKKVIMLDNDFTREYMKTYYRDITNARFIDHALYPFNALTEIYDGTVSYVTVEEKKKIGVIIKNESIYKMQKSLFEFIWQHAKKFLQEVVSNDIR